LGQAVTTAAPNGNYELKISQLFIEFPITFIRNLKTVDRSKTFFLLKLFTPLPTLLPMDSVARKGSHHSPTPPSQQLRPHL